MLEVCEEIYKENYIDWYMDKKLKENKIKAEEKLEEERIQRIMKAKEKKRKLLEKIGKKILEKSPIGKN